jgi:hypothetical protein
MLSVWFNLMCVVGGLGKYEAMFDDMRDKGLVLHNMYAVLPPRATRFFVNIAYSQT